VSSLHAQYCSPSILLFYEVQRPLTPYLQTCWEGGSRIARILILGAIQISNKLSKSADFTVRGILCGPLACTYFSKLMSSSQIFNQNLYQFFLFSATVRFHILLKHLDFIIHYQVRITNYKTPHCVIVSSRLLLSVPQVSALKYAQCLRIYQSINFPFVSRFGRRERHCEKLCCFRKRLKYYMQLEQFPRNGGEIHPGILWSLWRWAVQRVCPKWKIDGNFVYVIICCLTYPAVSVPLQQTETIQTV
jgi:hypothetical protein